MSKTAAKASVVNHTVASYDITDNPETHMTSAANLPKFRLQPKDRRSMKIAIALVNITNENFYSI